MSKDSKSKSDKKIVSRGRKIQGSTYRDNCLTIRFNKEEFEILETVTKSMGLDKASSIRSLLQKEYKRILRDKASQENLFK